VEVGGSDWEEIFGLVTGNLKIEQGSKAKLEGIVSGNVIVEHSARFVVGGMVRGSIKNFGGLVEVHGMILGDVMSEKQGIEVSEPGRILGAILNPPPG